MTTQQKLTEFIQLVKDMRNKQRRAKDSSVFQAEATGAAQKVDTWLAGNQNIFIDLGKLQVKKTARPFYNTPQFNHLAR